MYDLLTIFELCPKRTYINLVPYYYHILYRCMMFNVVLYLCGQVWLEPIINLMIGGLSLYSHTVECSTVFIETHWLGPDSKAIECSTVFSVEVNRYRIFIAWVEVCIYRDTILSSELHCTWKKLSSVLFLTGTSKLCTYILYFSSPLLS